jgi:hypothetical protein
MEKLSNYEGEPEGEKSESKERHSIYPERVSDSFEKVIDDIRRLESGELVKYELSDLEKQELFEYEREFALRLDGLHKLDVASFEYFPSYFETEEGRRVLARVLGVENESETSQINVRELLYKNRNTLYGLETKDREKIRRDSEKHAHGLLVDELIGQLNENNFLSVTGVEAPIRTHLVLNPEEMLTKLSGLRELKREIKEAIQDLATKEGNSSRARKTVLEIYSKRINELIANLYSHAFNIEEASREFGVEALSDSEREILGLLSISESGDIDRSRARLDKFRYGASREYNERGYREQVSSELLEYADSVEAEKEDLSEKRDELILSRGLDPEKVDAKIITSADRKAWGERILKAYGLLSDDPSEDVRKRSVDDKWRYIVEEGRKSMSVDRIWKVVKDKSEKSGAVHAFPVALAHEIEGHVLQSANQEEIRLYLFKLDVAGDRSSVYSEGGAMHNQSIISREIFGYEEPPKPHYVRAMATRLRGGNYIDCVKTYYDSAIKSARDQYKNGTISKDDFDKKARALLGTATSSARRLFRNAQLSSEATALLSSKDTAYLEQKKLVEGLRDAGLLKLAYVGGLNLENARELIRFGLLNLDRVQEPKFETLKIWEEEKEKYSLQSKSS